MWSYIKLSKALVQHRMTLRQTRPSAEAYSWISESKSLIMLLVLALCGATSGRLIGERKNFDVGGTVLI